MLDVKNLVKEYETGKKEGRRKVRAVDGVTLTITEGELFTLLGPSGCGKTTTLRSIAGLETPSGGEITLGGRVLYSSERHVTVPSNRRGLGMVFQSYAIWPHLNVFDNVAFPLTVLPRRQRPSRKQIRERVERSLEVVQLGHLSGRPSTDLSGGQQQRLALARALANEPPLLLLDEPLSNLDAKLREDMRVELKRLQRDLGITSVYVTHDQVEALAMSSRIAVMSDGRVQQLGTPREIYERPASAFVADFIGTTNFVEGTVVSVADDGTVRVDTSVGPIEGRTTTPLQAQDPVVVTIRPEDIQLSADDNPAPGRLTGTIRARSFLGELVEYVVENESLTLRARCAKSVRLREGTAVQIDIRADDALVLPRPA